MRNTRDILRKYCNLQINNVSLGSASVQFEQPSDQDVQKMAPQQKKTASPKKIAAKKTPLRKTAPKKTGSKTTKKMSPKMKTTLNKTAAKKITPKKTSPKKIAPKKTNPKKTFTKKTSPKKTAPKKVALKKAALKKKIATKRSAKVGERVAKKDSVKGKKNPISKSSEERAARAARRSLPKEAPAAKEPSRKRARLDSSSDLINLLTASATVLDIFAASGSRPLPKEVITCQDLYFLLCIAFLICVSQGFGEGCFQGRRL